MLIIGERINSSRKPIASAITAGDFDFLINQARLQINSGANFIDVNCAISMEKEKENLIRIIQIIQKNLNNIPISIDSPNPEMISHALKVHIGKPFINSVTAETDKLNSMVNILKKHDAFIIVLTMSDKGMPNDADERVSMAMPLVSSLTAAGINKDNIFIDPLVKPISSEPEQAKYFLEAVKALKKEKIKTIGGLSNVSYGLPVRHILNAAFLTLAKEAGIDAAIIDPVVGCRLSVVDQKDEIFKLAKAALLGEDTYCMNYIKAFRQGKLTENP